MYIHSRSILGRFTVVIFVFMLLYLFNQTTNIVLAQQTSSNRLEILWVKYGQEGKAFATCVSGSTVFGAGGPGFKFRRAR